MLQRCGIILMLVIALVPVSSFGQRLDREKLRWMTRKPPITEIVIEGNEFFSDNQIQERMYSRERGVFEWLRDDRRARIQRETIGRDTLEIKYLYFVNGFLNADVDEDFRVELPDSNAVIIVSINEGRRYFYDTVIVQGDYDSTLFYDDLRKIANRFTPGKPINPIALRQAALDMKTVLANDGYPYADILEVVDTSVTGTSVPVVFTIEADSLTTFGVYRIEGLDRYPQKVVRRELKIEPGDTYSRMDIIDSQRRLIESGYFTTFQIQRDPDSENRLRPNFVVRVRERKARYLTFTTGASQSEEVDLQWDVSAGFGKRNFLGSRRYDIGTRVSFDLGTDSRLIDHVYSVRYTEPWFAGFRMPLILTGEIRPKVQSLVQPYDISSWSISASTTRRIRDIWRIDAGIEYESINISGIPEDQVELLRAEEDAVRRKVFFEFRRDTRDNLFVPRTGNVMSLLSELYGGVLGGDENLYKLDGSFSAYKVVWPGWIAAARVRGGLVREFPPSQEVPRDDRFYIGGANTVRGFNERALGPTREDGDPDGGNIIGIVNMEFRWKTLQVFSVVPFLKKLFRNLPLYQSIFFDAGNGFRLSREIALDNLAYSYGTGIQIVSPAGPIRIDYARRIKTEDIGYADRWHFTILYAF